jgi:HNH endonuclease
LIIYYDERDNSTYVNLKINNKWTRRILSKLIYETFIQKYDGTFRIKHKNLNIFNNSIDNLLRIIVDPKIWKVIPGLDKMYYANREGQIYSVKSDKILNGGLNEYKYVYIKNKHYYVHKLVYIAFHGKIQEGMVIDHKDKDKLNNKLSNLREVTATKFLTILNNYCKTVTIKSHRKENEIISRYDLGIISHLDLEANQGF